MSPSTLSEEESALAKQCLEFCQALAQKGQKFSFSLKTNSFSISMDTMEKEHTKETRTVKMKLSPSALWRNQKRKEAFLKRKAESNESEQLVEESPKPADITFKCDQCENTFGSENGLKIHIGRTHKPAIEKLRLRGNPESPPLTLSPPKEPPREEQCEYCGDTMSPGHQCDEDKVKCKACGMVVNPECHE